MTSIPREPRESGLVNVYFLPPVDGADDVMFPIAVCIEGVAVVPCTTCGARIMSVTCFPPVASYPPPLRSGKSETVTYSVVKLLFMNAIDMVLVAASGDENAVILHGSVLVAPLAIT